MLAIMDKICERFEQGQVVEAATSRASSNLSRSLPTSATTERKRISSSGMVAAGVPNEGGPIGVMLAEHKKGREFVKAMKDVLAGSRSGEAGAISDFVKNARKYIACSARISIKRISSSTHGRPIDPASRQAQLLKEFEKVEEEIVGHGKHEEFHALLEKLQIIYS